MTTSKTCECGKPAKARGLCSAHYQQVRRAERNAAGNPIRRTLGYQACKECGSKGVLALGFCSPCYYADYRARRTERDGPRTTWPGYRKTPYVPTGRPRGRPKGTGKQKTRINGDGRRKTNNDIWEA